MQDEIQRMVTYHREWLEKNGPRILTRDSSYLLEDIADGTPSAFQQIPDSLDGLATYFAILGTVEVLDGKDTGWDNISTAIDFRGWSLKLRVDSFSRDVGVGTTNLTNYVSRAACLVCVSEKWGEMAECVLRHVNENPHSIDQEYWKRRRFEPFVLRCCQIRDGEAVAQEELERPYRDVLEGWSNAAALSKSLDAVCEYHAANMDDVGGDWDPEFKYPPFDLLPCEVMFIRRIRKHFAMPLPYVSHDLVHALNPSDDIVIAQDEHEWLSRLSTAFDRCYA